MVPLESMVVTPVAPSFAAGVAGTSRTMVFDVADASGYFEDVAEAWLWGRSTATGSGYLADGNHYENAVARGTVEKRRWPPPTRHGRWCRKARIQRR